MLGNRIKKKLKSTQGTSIFFGLLLFMVASILSAVMISASVTTVKRVESDRQTEQNYLTCSSAAKLLRDEIVNTKIKYYREITTKQAIGTSPSRTVYDTPENERWKYELKDTSILKEFAKFLQDYVQTFKERGAATPADTLQRTYIISVPNNATDTEKGLAQVKADCTIQNAKNGNGYDIVIKFSTGDTADDCKIVTYLTGAVVENPQSNIDINEKTTTIIEDNTYSWTATDFIYGDQARTSEAG